MLGLLKLFFNLMGIEDTIKDIFQNCTHTLLLGNPSASMHTACSTEWAQEFTSQKEGEWNTWIFDMTCTMSAPELWFGLTTTTT